MNSFRSLDRHRDERLAEGITRISVGGYKSIKENQSVEIRPLTLLAGANSSGKSSIMQPLLLLKQTLEASYDPGSLLLDGPNVKFTSADQLLSRTTKDGRVDRFRVAVELGSAGTLTTVFRRQVGKGLDVTEMSFVSEKERTVLREDMSHTDIIKAIPRFKELGDALTKASKAKAIWTVTRERCFLGVSLVREDGEESIPFSFWQSPSGATAQALTGLIHLPGLRGNPQRSYPVTAVGRTFPGTFEHYVASIIVQWQPARSSGNLARLGRSLERLGLTWKARAQPVNDTQVELQVGRLCHATRGGAQDLVSIADVGFGVSQTLPVIVALLAAEPGQLVYLEQPEIHLHPRAQVAMAQVLADAANRGVRVVAETHSALLLLGVQSLVAEGKLPANLVKLHWFRRDAEGATQVTSSDLDNSGAFGDWPEDFAEVTMEAQRLYLDAAEVQQRGG